MGAEDVVRRPVSRAPPGCDKVLDGSPTQHPAGHRAVAQLGSALDWGSRGRRFKSCQPDREALICFGRSGPFHAPELPPSMSPKAGGLGPFWDHHSEYAAPASSSARVSGCKYALVTAGSW